MLGRGFIGGGTDLAESDHVAVIGPNTTCPLDDPSPRATNPPRSSPEAVADGAGEKEADANGDGTVTANELKAWLREAGWTLGVPDDEEPGRKKSRIKNGKSACVPRSVVPASLPTFVRPGSRSGPRATLA